MAYGNMTEGKGSVWYQGKRIVVPMSDVKIFEGSVVFVNSSGKALWTASSGAPFLGVARETVDNTANTGKEISVLTEGVYEFTSSSLTGADIGKTVYLNTSANPNTVSVTKPSTSGALIAPIGKIVKVNSATECMVRIDGFACVTDVTSAS